MSEPPVQIREELVPVNELLSGESSRIVGAALGELDLRSLAPVYAAYVPERAVTVAYRADVGLDSGDGWEGMIVAHSGPEPPFPVSMVSDGRTPVAVWRFPDDPWLPGLRRVLDPAVTRSLLEQVDAGPEGLALRVVSYRPTRRAVVEVRTATDWLFLKVTSPERARVLWERHRTLAGTVPVPHSLGWSEELGAVVLEAMPGDGLRHLIHSGSAGLPDPLDLVGLLDSLPEAVMEYPAGHRPVDTVPAHQRLLARVTPALSDQVAAVAEACRADERPLDRAVHGDFHPAQVLVQRGRVSGLVDVDSAGRGHREDDLGTMLGNLSVLVALGAPSSAGGYLEETLRTFDGLADPDTLRRAAAAAVLGYATGPFRSCDPDWPETTRRLVAVAADWAVGL